jgi:hypothetical protein
MVVVLSKQARPKLAAKVNLPIVIPSPEVSMCRARDQDVGGSVVFGFGVESAGAT